MAPPVTVYRQRVRARATPVQGEHELHPEPFAQRVPGDLIVKLGHDRLVPAELQVGLGLRLDGEQPALVQGHGRGTDRMRDDIRVRRAPP